VSHHIRVVGPTRVSLELFDYESTDEAETKVSPGMKWADLKFVYGWDQPLQTFFLHVHDAFAADPDANPVIWFGATKDKVLYEVEDSGPGGAALRPAGSSQEMRTGLSRRPKDDGV
jgi:hypothetical protein